MLGDGSMENRDAEGPDAGEMSQGVCVWLAEWVRVCLCVCRCLYVLVCVDWVGGFGFFFFCWGGGGEGTAAWRTGRNEP